MDGKRLLFLINPNAGKSEIRQHLLEIVDIFSRGGYTVTVRPSRRRQEIIQLAKDYSAQYDMVVCCGGDGTLNEAVNGLMRCDSREQIPFGYIPTGTTNDFATSLGIPKNMPAAAERIVGGESVEHDLGRFGNRYFTYIAAFGAFTEVSYQTPQQSKNNFGRLAYFVEGIRALNNLKPHYLRVVNGEEKIEGDFIFGMVTNSRSIAGFKFLAAHDVEPDDGLLEATFIRLPKNMEEVQELLNSLLLPDAPSEFIKTFKTSNLSVTSEEPIPWTVDGEYCGTVDSAVISCQNRALRIIR